MKKIFERIRNEKAFTLIEAVVAIGIIGIIGVIMSDILTRAFDNTQKTNLISNVQQNGQAALSAFEDTIRYAEFVCVGGTDASGTAITPNQTNPVVYQRPLLVVFKDGKFIRYRIVPQNGTVNGYIAEDFPAPPGIDTTATDLCTSASAASNLRRITNDTTLSVKSGTITLLSNPINTTTSSIGTSKVSVTISFSMGASANANGGARDQIGQNNEIVFQTTSQFR